MARNGHLVSTPLAFSRCGFCGALTLSGIDEGRPFRLEPTPVSVDTELAARKSGRDSWTVENSKLVYYRDARRIMLDIGKPVCLSHDCDASASDIDRGTAAVFADTIRRVVKRDTSQDEALVLLRRELGATVYAKEAPF